VAYLNLELWRDAPSTGTPNHCVHAWVGLFDDVYDRGSGDAKLLAGLDFAAQGFTFLTAGDAGRYSAVFQTASCVTSAVPEPSTWALMAIGIGALALRSRRRRA